MSVKQRVLDYIIDQFDPRMGKQVGGAERKEDIRNTIGTRVVVEDAPMIDRPLIDLRDFEGRGIMTTMSDRTAGGGMLSQIDNVRLNQPVDLQGGQNFMFLNPGSVWASADDVVAKMQREAAKLRAATGKDPLYAPWMMSPTGGDFSTMPGDAMLAYIDSTASKKLKNELTQDIRQLVPEWKGFDANWYEQFSKMSGNQRKAIQRILDAKRDQTGIGSGKARGSVTDREQLTGRDGRLLNIGEVNVAGKVQPSKHRTYPMTLPGEGLGKVNKDDMLVTQLFPETTDQFGKVRRTLDPNNPQRPDLRSFEVRPVGGIIDEKMLKRIYGSMGAISILGALAGNPDKATASSLPGGVTMPSMASIRESVAQEQQSRSAENVNDILNFLDPAFIMPQALGGGVDTMDGYLRSQTR